MTIPSRITAEQRRHDAVAALAKGERPTHIARALGVSRTSVYRWLAMAEAGALASSKATGRRSRLTEAQRKQVELALWEKKAIGDGLTAKIAADLIRGLTGVRYGADYAGELMRKWKLR